MNSQAVLWLPLQSEALIVGKNNPTVVLFPRDGKALVLLALGESTRLGCREKRAGDGMQCQRQRELL